MNLRSLAGLALLLLPVAAARAESEPVGPAIGEPAPELVLEGLLQAPEGAATTWDALRGRVVVLEFWATWCLPCLEAMPHIDDLARRFEDREVLVLAITAEDEESVRRYLDRHGFGGWIGLDTDSSTFESYNAWVVPHTVVVDGEGRIAAVTWPDRLTEPALRDLVAGTTPDLPVKRVILADLERFEPGDETSYQAMIEASGATSARSRSESRTFSADGLPLRTLVMAAFGVSDHRVDLRADASDEVYSVRISVPKGREGELDSFFQTALVEEFGLRVRWEPRRMVCHVLRRAGGTPAPPRPSSDGGQTIAMAGDIRIPRGSVATLASTLESWVDHPVVDESGLEGDYELVMKFDPTSGESFARALRGLGMTLTTEERSVDVLVLEAAGSP